MKAMNTCTILQRRQTAANIHVGLVAVMLFSLLQVSTPLLLNGKISVQANPPRGWVNYSDGDDTCSKVAESFSNNDEQEKSQGWNVTGQIYNMRPKRKHLQSTEDIGSMEEKDRRELEWVVRNTDKILGPGSPTVGSMSQGMIQITYDLMSTWGRRASKKDGSDAPHVVERLLQRLIKEQDSGNTLVVIDTMVYNLVLDAWSNSSAEGSAERSEEILLQMERMFIEDGNEEVRPDETSYNAVVKAFVKNGNRHIAATKAEALLKHMEEKGELMDVSPNRRSYNLVLYAFANSNVENASTHAEEILHRMLNRYVEGGDHACKPDVNSYNQVITAWARGKNPDFEARMQGVYEELLNLPKNMGIRPNTDTFNTVMGGWLKSDHTGALDIVESVFATMEQSYAGGNTWAKPDRVTINTLAASYVRSGKPGAIEKSVTLASVMERKYQITSNTVSHNIVVDSWCKSGRSDAPGRVIDLLNTMERAFKGGKTNMKPDGYTYSSVVGCFTRFKRADATHVAEALLERMQQLYLNFDGESPTTSVYNAVINAWASCSEPLRAQKRVKQILRIMEENDGRDPIIPKANRITYNTVIKAMRDGKEESARYAEKILTTLETKGSAEIALLPDSYSYTSVITAYGRSDARNKAEKALQILERMILAHQRGNMAAAPTTHSFNAVLNACAFANGDAERKGQAFDIAMKTYDLLREKGVPDHTSYGTLLRICATLLPPADERREKLVDDIFQRACESGNVGRMVITQLKFACLPHQHIRLIGRASAERIDTRELPKSWTRNVRETNRRT